MEVRGPAKALGEVRGPLAVLAAQVESAMQQCDVLAALRLRPETDALTGLATRAVRAPRR